MRPPGEGAPQVIFPASLGSVSNGWHVGSTVSGTETPTGLARPGGKMQQMQGDLDPISLPQAANRPTSLAGDKTKVG
jgi:hypothetical protein